MHGKMINIFKKRRREEKHIETSDAKKYFSNLPISKFVASTLMTLEVHLKERYASCPVSPQMYNQIICNVLSS